MSHRALLVTPFSPWSESSGAQQRTALLYEALAQELPVDVLVLEEGRLNRVAGAEREEVLAHLGWKQPALALYKFGVHAWANGWCHSNIDWSRYSVVVSRYLTPATKVRWPAHLRTIVDCDDALYQYPPQSSGFFDRAAAAARSWLRFQQTKLAIGNYDHVFYCSARDRGRLGGRSSSVLPNVVRAPREAPAPQAATTALIVGSMWYSANRQGVEWFLARCWPGIVERCPGISLRIIGAASDADRQRWARAQRVEAPGYVGDLAAEYARASFTIAPIHYGGGTCIKFLESGAHARACVATAHVLDAFQGDFRGGESAMVARGPEGMIDACVTLFRDARLRDAIARRAREVVTRHYTVQRFSETVREVLQRVLSVPAGGPARRDGSAGASAALRSGRP